MKQKILRRVIRIDEDKCDGCGFCAKACHEGAIVIENGKAKLKSESTCDGLGDCVGECPKGAISFEMREAEAYLDPDKSDSAETKKTLPCGCPGSSVVDMRTDSTKASLAIGAKKADTGAGMISELVNWPIQLKLVPVDAPYLRRAPLVLAADCTGFALPGFQQAFLEGGKSMLLVGCPKLDDANLYEEKLSQILKNNKTPQLTVVIMEVPCCSGLWRLAEAAVDEVGMDIDLIKVVISIDGNIKLKETIKYRYKSN